MLMIVGLVFGIVVALHYRFMRIGMLDASVKELTLD
jgi:hypothetical protein